MGPEFAGLGPVLPPVCKSESGVLGTTPLPSSLRAAGGAQAGGELAGVQQAGGAERVAERPVILRDTHALHTLHAYLGANMHCIHTHIALHALNRITSDYVTLRYITPNPNRSHPMTCNHIAKHRITQHASHTCMHTCVHHNRATYIARTACINQTEPHDNTLHYIT